jgi:hypothetical protein
MNYRTRTILFIVAIAAFAVLGYIAVMYGQGYKYNLSEGRFFRTGAISLKANDDAKVFINDKLQGGTSFIGNTFGKEGFLPGRYTVRLQRDGYSTWQKVATVSEGQVIDFPRVLLLPVDDDTVMARIASESAGLFVAPHIIVAPTKTGKSSSVQNSFFIKDKTLYRTLASSGTPQVVASQVLGFSFSNTEQTIAWWTRNELFVMWLRDTDFQPFKKAGERELITRFTAPIRYAAWYFDDAHLVVDSGAYKIVEIDTRGGVNIIKL